MSFWQVQHVLMEYYHCNEAQSGKVIVSFGKKRFFKFIDDRHCLRANRLMDNSKLDMNMVIVLSEVLEKCHITQEVEPVIMDGSTDRQISLIADNSLYYVLKLPAKPKDFIPKLFVAQSNYQQTAKIISGNNKHEVFGYTTRLVFSSETDIDDTLDTIGETEIVMPYEIHFAKLGEIYKEIDLERFAEDPDATE